MSSIIKNLLKLKQKQSIKDDNFTLSGVAFTIDNAGDNDCFVRIGTGAIKRKIKAGEEFIISPIQNGYYSNLRFEIEFVGTGVKQVLIWYSDFTKKC